MKIIKKTKRKKTRARDSKKERTFRMLAEVLRAEGFSVRREELKRGPNWRAVSGCCRAVDTELILVDRRLEQDEQIAFLLSRIIELGIKPAADKLEDLPNTLKRALLGSDQGADNASPESAESLETSESFENAVDSSLAEGEHQDEASCA